MSNVHQLIKSQPKRESKGMSDGFILMFRGIQKQPWYNRGLADEFRGEYLREKNALESTLDAQAMAADVSLQRMTNPAGFV